MDLLGGGLGRGQGQERQGEKAQHGAIVARWAGVVNESGGFAGALEAVLGPVVSGVVPGRPGQEVLTVLEGGEAVLPRAALAARTAGVGGSPQQVQVVVENRGATQQEVVEQRAVMDGGRLVVNVALDDITRRGPLSQALEQSYNLRRRTG